jgi:hypothetical protein
MFILDTASVARLIWASLGGHAGEWARLVAIGLMLPPLWMVALAVWRRNPAPPARRKKASVRPSRGSKSKSKRIGGRDGVLNEQASVADCRTKSAPSAAFDRL